MSREEYLNDLKNHLQSLTTDELAEALQYYSDYFEEASDDEKVIAKADYFILGRGVSIR